MADKDFSEDRLQVLIDKWLDGAESFWRSYKERCELVYQIWKETAKPGCKGGFTAARAQMKLPDSTAYDMIAHHQIKIGERLDPDAPDARDEKEEKEVDPPPPPPPPKPKPASVTLRLENDLPVAIAAVREFFQLPDDKATVRHCVLTVWHDISPKMEQTEDPDAETIELGDEAA